MKQFSYKSNEYIGDNCISKTVMNKDRSQVNRQLLQYNLYIKLLFDNAQKIKNTSPSGGILFIKDVDAS